MAGGGSAAREVGAGVAAKGLGGAAAKEGLTFAEIGAGELKASIELAKKGGVKVIAVDPAAPAAAAVKELEGLGGQFVKGVAADVAPGTADHAFRNISPGALARPEARSRVEPGVSSRTPCASSNPTVPPTS